MCLWLAYLSDCLSDQPQLSDIACAWHDGVHPFFGIFLIDIQNIIIIIKSLNPIDLCIQRYPAAALSLQFKAPLSRFFLHRSCSQGNESIQEKVQSKRFIISPVLLGLSTQFKN